MQRVVAAGLLRLGQPASGSSRTMASACVIATSWDGDRAEAARYSQPVSFLDLVDAVGFPKTTVHRLVAALETHGLLRRDDSGRLVTGSRLATASLSQLAMPIMVRLTRTTGESTQPCRAWPT